MSILPLSPRKIKSFPSIDEEIVFDYKDGGQISITSYGPILGEEHLLIIHNKNFNTLTFYVLATQSNHHFQQTDYVVKKKFLTKHIGSIKGLLYVLDDYKKTLTTGGYGYQMGKIQSIINQISQLIGLNNREFLIIKHCDMDIDRKEKIIDSKKRIIDSKIKLIEELKKKCKPSIKNSLSRKSKKTFNPTLNTIPNTKTRNSKSRRSRSQSHND